jgi:hypothetical protein
MTTKIGIKNILNTVRLIGKFIFLEIYYSLLMLSNEKKRAKAVWFKNTQLLPQRGKSCSVEGFAALPIGKAAGGSKGV